MYAVSQNILLQKLFKLPCKEYPSRPSYKNMDADDTWIAERGVGVVRKSGASVSKEVGQDIYKETEDDDGNGIFGDSDITNGSEADSDPPQHLGTYHHLSTKT